MADYAVEHAVKRLIASAISHARPRCFRNGKPARYPQRTHVTVATSHPSAVPGSQLPWTSHVVTTPVAPQRNPRLQDLRAESEPRPFSSFLTDNYSREHNYLRISVTERCNLRCVYCMPEEGVPLSPSKSLLTTPEIVYLSTLFVNQGVSKIRLTGGEPTVRRDIVELMQQLGGLRKQGLKELCLTTNGISLHRKLDAMVESGLTGINLSLDTLDPYQFTIMTRRNGHDVVMKSINRILEMNKLGANIKLKINCVVMRGVNEREIVPFVEMTRETDLEVRFIEYMPFDGNKWSKGKMLGFTEMLALISQKYPDVHRVQDLKNDTSKTYQIPGFVGRMGFITSMTHNFCGTCNRLRITSDGNLKVCLFGNAEVSLRDILRESNDSNPLDAEALEAIKEVETGRSKAVLEHAGPSPREARLLEVIGAAVKRKKEKHAGMDELENMKNRPMILIDKLPVLPQSQPPVTSEFYSVARDKIVLALSPRKAEHGVPLNLLSHLVKGHLFSGSYQIRHSSTYSRPPTLSPSIAHRRSFSDGSNDPPLRRVHIAGRYASEPLVRYKHSSGLYRTIPTPDPATLPSFARTTWQDVRLTYSSRQAPQPSRDAIHSAATSGNFSPFSSSTRTAAPSHTRSAVPEASLTATPGMKSQPNLSHLNSQGEARMVSISQKSPTHRTATASSLLVFSTPATHPTLTSASLAKGDAIACARIAGIQAAKQTPLLIPLAHPGLGLTGVSVKIDLYSPRPQETSQHIIEDYPHGCALITATVSCLGPTGVEMEALTAATIAGLTLYDMCKAIDKGMVLSHTRVIEKKGGQSGHWKYDAHLDRTVRLSPDANPTTSGPKISYVSTTKQKRGNTADPDEELLASAMYAQTREVRQDAIRERISQLDKEMEAGLRNVGPVYATVDGNALADHRAKLAEEWEKTQQGTWIA